MKDAEELEPQKDPTFTQENTSQSGQRELSVDKHHTKSSLGKKGCIYMYASRSHPSLRKVSNSRQKPWSNLKLLPGLLLSSFWLAHAQLTFSYSIEPLA